MNREEIIRMAREAGMVGYENYSSVRQSMLERFAALVAAAERERNTKEFPVQFGSVKAFEDWCADIRRNEREACAKVCEAERRLGIDDERAYYGDLMAAAIRERSSDLRARDQR